MQSAPGFRKDLHVVIVSADGDFVSYVGTRMPFYLSFGFEPLHHISVWRRRL
jgi:hypothetical protein